MKQESGAHHLSGGNWELIGIVERPCYPLRFFSSRQQQIITGQGFNPSHEKNYPDVP
ncbi:hypothetical protein [Allocoleopsis sp.]|uniref:hypothetical protein n=1 Tax=Allocoleopsis sp. TaxID=3088169 RepID=UPI002FD122D0